MYDRTMVTALLLAEVGYREKATNDQLDDPAANAGSGNYTKYARDLAAVGYYNSSKRGADWCAVFVNWGMFKAFGKETALALACQPDTDNCGAGCGYAFDYYKRRGQLHQTNPQEGDQIFFWSSDRKTKAHTGYVYAVDGEHVHTVEGNVSGRVKKKQYRLTDSSIAGYGRPDWRMEDTGVDAPAESAPSDSNCDLGDRTLTIGSVGEDVKALQDALNQLPCTLPKLTVDGIFGTNTARAVYNFQTIQGIKVDNKYGPESHRTLMAALDQPPAWDAMTLAEKVEDLQNWRLSMTGGGDAVG